MIVCVTRHEKTGLKYIHKIHLFILQYVSPLVFKILDNYKPYEKLHKWCKYYWTPMITHKVV